MQMSENEKRNILETQLSEGSRDVNATISDTDLLQVLNKKNQGKPFSEDLYAQLTGQLEKTGTPLTIRNFVDIWLQAEARLVNSVNQLDGEIQAQGQEKEDLIEQKKKIGEEQLNAYGIMNNSQLVVTMRSVEAITRADGTPTNANFLLSCEGQSAETGNSVDPNLFNINKTFKFNVKTGTDPLIINLIPTASNDPKDGGYIQIPLTQLSDQERINQMFTFQTEYNHLMETNANLDLQWVYSNVKMLNRGIKNLDEGIQIKRRNKESAEAYIEELYSPFPPLKKTLKQREKTMATGPFNPNTNMVNEKQFSKMPESTHSIFSKLLLYAIYVYFFIAFLLSYHRCVFLDLLVALLFFSSVLLNNPKLIKSFVNKVIAGVVLAMLIDVVWLIFYTNYWWNGTYQDSFSLLYIRRIMVVLSYVIMAVRVFVLVVLGVAYNDFGTGEDEFEAETDSRYQNQQVFGQY